MSHGTDLQQCIELGAADGTVVGLVAQVVSASVAEAEVSARQDQSVAWLTHADDTLRPVVIHLVTVARLQDTGPLSLRTHVEHDNNTTQQPFNGLWSRTTRVGRYQKKHSPTHTHPDHWTSSIIFLHLQCSMASSLFSLRA